MKRKKKQNKAELQNQPASEEVSSQVSLDLNPDGVSDGDDSLQTAAETDSAGEAQQLSTDKAILEELQAIMEKTAGPKEQEEEPLHLTEALTEELAEAILGEKPTGQELESASLRLKELSAEEATAFAQQAGNAASKPETAQEASKQSPNNAKGKKKKTGNAPSQPNPEPPVRATEPEIPDQITEPELLARVEEVLRLDEPIQSASDKVPETRRPEEITQEEARPVRKPPLASMSYESVAEAAESLKKEPTGRFTRDAVDEGEFLSEICSLIGDGTRDYQPRAGQGADVPQPERRSPSPRPAPRISVEDLHAIPDTPEDILENDSTGVSGWVKGLFLLIISLLLSGMTLYAVFSELMGKTF